jgi:hypothetical protein
MLDDRKFARGQNLKRHVDVDVTWVQAVIAERCFASTPA